MAARNVLVVGAGGHGRSVAEAIGAGSMLQIVGFIDDNLPMGALIQGIPVLGSSMHVSDYRSHADAAVVCIGNNSVREWISTKLLEAGFDLVSVIHPRAIVSPSANIGCGCTIMAGAVVGTEVVLGQGVIVNSGAVVDHHAQVGAYGHLGVNACMAGGSVLGRGAWMYPGSSIGYGVKVEDGQILGVGVALI